MHTKYHLFNYLTLIGVCVRHVSNLTATKREVIVDAVSTELARDYGWLNKHINWIHKNLLNSGRNSTPKK